MIKPNELRIGNSVLTDRGVVDIVKFAYNEVRCYVNDIGTQKRMFGFEIKQIDPVPLTDEWLVKFGFALKSNRAFNTWKIGAFHINGGQRFYTPMAWCDMEIIYVHQLQNLYFALTGKELTHEN